MADRPLPYRKLLRILRRYGVTEDRRRGKGSERLLQRTVGGRKEVYPIKCHKEGEVKPTAVVKAVRRRLRLTQDDGILDDEFYG
jgi:hypothetical protein